MKHCRPGGLADPDGTSRKPDAEPAVRSALPGGDPGLTIRARLVADHDKRVAKFYTGPGAGQAGHENSQSFVVSPRFYDLNRWRVLQLHAGIET
jgi:hypothetical protein